MLTSSLRSHFLKHLPCTTLFSPSLRPTLSPLLSLTQNKWVAFKSTASTMLSTATSFASSPYFSVRIHCPKDVSDNLSEALLCFGASSTSMDEQENHMNNNKVYITSIFTDCQDVDECIVHAAKSIGLEETPTYQVTEGDQSNWIKLSQESFQPVEITKGHWTVPEWITPPGRVASIVTYRSQAPLLETISLNTWDPRATNIILNPGFAFGTGDHPTTKLCLLLLNDLIKGGELVLDYGTGSGVLAIAALKFGAALSVGLDIDPEAITSARHNATLNNINEEKLELYLVGTQETSPKEDETRKYDVVIANILLNPLLDLADDIVSYAKPGAVVGLSGILSEQVPRIVERYSQFLEGISMSKMDDWACISGTKKINI